MSRTEAVLIVYSKELYENRENIQKFTHGSEFNVEQYGANGFLITVEMVEKKKYRKKIGIRVYTNTRTGIMLDFWY